MRVGHRQASNTNPIRETGWGFLLPEVRRLMWPVHHPRMPREAASSILSTFFDRIAVQSSLCTRYALRLT